MSTLNEQQVRDAALNVVDGLLDISVDSQSVKESADTFFENGWTQEDGEGDTIEVEVNPDTEDYAAINEEANSILRFLRDRTDLYYD